MADSGRLQKGSLESLGRYSCRLPALRRHEVLATSRTEPPVGSFIKATSRARLTFSLAADEVIWFFAIGRAELDKC